MSIMLPPAWWTRDIMYCHCGTKILRFFDGKEYHYHDWWNERQAIESCTCCGAHVREVDHWHKALGLMADLGGEAS